MTPNLLKDLIAQRASLDAQIAAVQSSERADAIQQVRSLMDQYGLSVADLTSRSSNGPKTGTHVAAKYRDKETGATWSGRGLKPKWLSAKLAAGQKIEDFAV